MVMYMSNPSFRIWRRKEQRKQKKLDEHYEKQLNAALGDEPIKPTAKENADFINKVLGDCSDLVTRSFTMEGEVGCAVLFIDELVNKEVVHNFLLRPLINSEKARQSADELWTMITQNIVEVGETKEADDLKTAVDAILSADTVLFIDGLQKALIVGTKGWATRGVSEPRAEAVVRGPREGLSETMCFSLAMIRHRLRDPNFRVKYHTIGKRTKTTVGLLYIEGLSDPKIVKKVTDRLKEIEIDGVLESGYIEEMIQDQIWTMFPLVQNTERPDTVVAHLLEGKVAILVEGTPHALIAPAVFTQFYYSPEDYYEKWYHSTFLRFIRLISMIIALLLPALYIAFVSFHPEMLPANLAIAMAAGRATVPFTATLEALLMEISVEILREASIRLPGPIGPTIGIVGALVIGNAAVTAGLVSPAIVIVVGLTTISSYANPSYNAAIAVRLLRFGFIILAAMFGLFGVMMGLMIMVLHLVQLRSLGIPYMAPFSPLNLRDLRDSLVRVPWRWMNRRPAVYRSQDPTRQGKGDAE
ncbi:spore germination protein [Laceyella tengchongensis]|uniref:Spore germination protein n=2 Tax=Laceyella tengchongensis TaxID=574699 RepID=A0AA46AE47_9BACL|nr:spore germination protein [Laceyella tengchongensis]